ncbi:MAG: glycerophosphodiester phosphodiesterase family protein [Acidimicrobiales bacterium]
MHSTTTARWGESPARQVADLARAGVSAVNLRWPEWRPELVSACRDGGLATLAWGVSRRATAVRLVRMGVDALYGDLVDVLMAAVARAQG